MLGGPAQDWSITLPLSNTRGRSQRAGGSGEPTGTPMPTPMPTPPPPPILKPPRPTPTLDCGGGGVGMGDRKSTRLNSSHQIISYAVFCLKKNNCTLQVVNRLNIDAPVSDEILIVLDECTFYLAPSTT